MKKEMKIGGLSPETVKLSQDPENSTFGRTAHTRRTGGTRAEHTDSALSSAWEDQLDLDLGGLCGHGYHADELEPYHTGTTDPWTFLSSHFKGLFFHLNLIIRLVGTDFLNKNFDFF